MYSLLLDSSNTNLSVGLAQDHQLIDEISYEAWQKQSEFMQPKAITVQSLYADFASKKDITKSNPVYLEGWVRTNRDNGSIGFIELNDGTCFKAIQIVYDSAIGDYAKVAHILTGAAIAVKGEIRLTPAMPLS